MNEQPNPGSDEAIDRGCTCPVFDNAHGRGAWGSEGENAFFWVNAKCPLHGSDERVRELKRQESVGAKNAQS